MNKLDKYRKSLTEELCKNRDIEILNSLYDGIIEKNRDQSMYFPLLVLVTLGKQTRKLEYPIHGYHAAIAIELIDILNKIKESGDHYIKKFGHMQYCEILIKITTIINKLLFENIAAVTSQQKNSSDVYVLIKILNEKINEITCHHDFTYVKNNNKDITKLKFNNIKHREIAIKNKLLSREQLDDFIRNKYCKLGELAFLFGCVLGTCSFDNIGDLEKISETMGKMIKISNDFKNYELDVVESNSATNVVLNLGITKSYELYYANKVKFNTIHQNSPLMSRTLKDIMAELDENVDCTINNAEPVSIETYTALDTSV